MPSPSVTRAVHVEKLLTKAHEQWALPGGAGGANALRLWDCAEQLCAGISGLRRKVLSCWRARVLHHRASWIMHASMDAPFGSPVPLLAPDCLSCPQRQALMLAPRSSRRASGNDSSTFLACRMLTWRHAARRCSGRRPGCARPPRRRPGRGRRWSWPPGTSRRPGRRCGRSCWAALPGRRLSPRTWASPWRRGAAGLVSACT